MEMRMETHPRPLAPECIDQAERHEQFEAHAADFDDNSVSVARAQNPLD
jgi:hypothetical protein